MINLNFYNGKRVLLTGHTGFKGMWLSLLLLRAGAEVTGYALDVLYFKSVVGYGDSHDFETNTERGHTFLTHIFVGGIDEILHLFSTDKTFGVAEVVRRTSFYLYYR